MASIFAVSAGSIAGLNIPAAARNVRGIEKMIVFIKDNRARQRGRNTHTEARPVTKAKVTAKNVVSSSTKLTKPQLSLPRDMSRRRQFPCTLGPAGVPTMPGDAPVPVGAFWGLLVGLVFAARPSFSFDGMRSDCSLVALG
jgi:hypothetical protein